MYDSVQEVTYCTYMVYSMSIYDHVAGIYVYVHIEIRTFSRQKLAQTNALSRGNKNTT